MDATGLSTAYMLLQCDGFRGVRMPWALSCVWTKSGHEARSSEKEHAPERIYFIGRDLNGNGDEEVAGRGTKQEEEEEEVVV